MLASFTIDDHITNPHDEYVEVTITLSDGQRRWCFFITPEFIVKALGTHHPNPKPIKGYEGFMSSIAYLGEKLTPSTGIPFGMVCAPHMIVTTTISEDIIETTLRYFDDLGELERISQPFGNDLTDSDD